MNLPDRSSPHPPATESVVRDALTALLDLELRMAEAVTVVAETEARVVTVVAAAMPESLADLGSSPAEAHSLGLSVDGTDEALAHASPRIASLAQALERVSRALRRTAALLQRIEAGWPRRSGADDRRAMARRQIARAVGERITRHAKGEMAERLFDDLHERLEAMEFAGDLDQPVEAVIAKICRALGLPTPEMDAAEARRMPGDGTLADFYPDG